MDDEQDLGVAPAGPGHQPTASAAEEASSQSGVPNADAIIKLAGDRYSPNLRRFLVRQKRPWRGLQNVYRDRDGILWIGWVDDTIFFIGCRLMRCLTVGGRAEVYAYPRKADELTIVPDFWARYAAIGRCAIDPLHNGWWSQEATRWAASGNTRSCLWCGNHTQHLRRWTETVKRERWEPDAQVGRNAKRQDAQRLGPKDEHAVLSEAKDAPTPSSPSGHTP